MRTGKLNISRGYQLDRTDPPVPRLSLVPRVATPQTPNKDPRLPPGWPEYHAVKERLAAIERLARLHRQGALTEEEFAAEKAALLSRPPEPVAVAPIPIEHRPDARPVRGPSLLGRLLGWKAVPVGLVAGLAFSIASQPRETLDFFNETLRLIGA